MADAGWGYVDMGDWLFCVEVVVKTEDLREAAGVLDTLTSKLPETHPLRVEALAKAKECVGRIYASADYIDGQAEEIERLKRVCRVAVLALAHASQEHGEVYQPAYQAVSDALQGDGNGSLR